MLHGEISYCDNCGGKNEKKTLRDIREKIDNKIVKHPQIIKKTNIGEF